MKLVFSRRRTVTTAGAVGIAMLATVGVVSAAPAEAATGCRVDYTISNSWPGGFGANVTIVNLGAPVTTWRLAWSFTAGQAITQLWSGAVTQSGAQVTVTNASFNGNIPTNGSATFGFNGTWNGGNPAPTSFSLNGVACTGDITAPTAPTTPGEPTPSQMSPSPSQPAGPGGGSGPYPAGYETSTGLPNHTVYRPERLPDVPLPIFVWGNGGCAANGTASLNFLQEIASHGFLVVASGRPNGTGSTTAAMLTQAMDWTVAENARQGSKYFGKLDTSKIAVAGWSCGGLEAYEVANDPRVTTVGIFSSGLLDDAKDYQLARLTKPIVYIIGGPGDIAYPNAVDDWGKLPASLPAFMGNLDVGHGGTYTQPNGGEFGRVTVLYLKWRLKGDRTAGATFVGTNCGLCGTQWQVRQKNLTL